mgnify:CR=1 FL=1
MTDDTLRVARATFERAEGAARDGASAVAEAAGEGVDKVRHFLEKAAQERPIATVSVAIGLGLLVGLLISNRRD